ncbi:MAG: AMP-binding protein [Paracoccaceae bacterium]
MNLPLTPNSRPWMKHYAKGVATDFNPPETTWTAMMNEAFEKFGPLTHIEYYGKEYTYDQTKALAAQVAAALKARGIGKGDRVALHLPNCPWHPIFFFGTIAAGAAVTHLSPLDADREIAHKMKDSGAKLLVSLTTPEFARHFPALIAAGEVPQVVLCPDPVSAMGRDCPVIEGAIGAEEMLAPHQGAPYAPEPVTPCDLALLQYTGGTTGVPKAAMLTHRNLSAAVQIYHESAKGEPSQTPESASLVYSPLFHIMGLTTALLKRTYEGGRLHLRLRYDPEQAVKEIEEKRIAAFGGVPTTWIGLLALPDIDSRDLSSLTYAGSGGAPLPVEVYNRVKQLTGLKIRGGWGMTETSPAGTNVPRDMPDEKLGTIGVPLPGLDMKIVDVEDASRTLGPNEPGEMAIMGPNVLGAYWNKPQETKEAFHDGWFLTGDIGYMDEDGYFFLVDRKKDMILSGGFNVYPLMIENAVHQHPDVAEAMAIGVPDDYRGESAKVYVVLNKGAAEFNIAQLQEFLTDKLGRHEIPRHLEFRAELPHTPVGKPDRKALKADEAAKREALETAS